MSVVKSHFEQVLHTYLIASLVSIRDCAGHLETSNSIIQL